MFDLSSLQSSKKLCLNIVLGYWHDRKGENEIDIVAEDELDNKIEFIEVKRQAKNFDEEILKAKSESFMKAVGSFNGYEIVYRGLSIEDM